MSPSLPHQTRISSSTFAVKVRWICPFTSYLAGADATYSSQAPASSLKRIKMFQNSGALDVHYQADHSKCTCCAAQIFKHADDLLRHCQYAHFACTLCDNGTAFLGQGWLDHHHRTEYPICCECKDSQYFKDHDHMRVHEHIAHGVFACSCGKSRIHWSMGERFHMEHCAYPNPCNDFRSADDIELGY